MIPHPQLQSLGVIPEFITEQVQAAHVFRVGRHADAHADIAIRIKRQIRYVHIAHLLIVQIAARVIHPKGGSMDTRQEAIMWAHFCSY